MALLHICNTFFELELDSAATYPVNKWLNSHPAVTQLQYLPILYAGPADRIGVSKIPDSCDPRFCLLDESPPHLPITSWGASKSIEVFAKAHGLLYHSPSIELVKEIQSKEFAYSLRPALPGSALLFTEAEVTQWIEQTQGPKVLKKVLGFAGLGHFFIDQSPHLGRFLAGEFKQGRPILAEPWLERKLDFSSQWEIGQTIELQGITTFETSKKGAYLNTFAGPLDSLFGPHRWAVDQHLAAALPLLQQIQAKGFFGSIGIDAFIYGDHQLQPIVEINARKTMSRVALMIQQQRAPEQILNLSFAASSKGLLPGNFARNIVLTFLPTP